MLRKLLITVGVVLAVIVLSILIGVSWTWVPGSDDTAGVAGFFTGVILGIVGTNAIIDIWTRA